MIRKIDVMMPVYSKYRALDHFTTKVYEALVRLGYECRLLDGGARFEVSLGDPPDLTVCFNGEFQIDNGKFLCDILKKPHLSCLVDPPFYFLESLKSPYMFVACDDLAGCKYLQKLKFQNSVFMPHAVEPELNFNPEKERIYDVVMLGSFLEFDEMWQGFANSLSPEMCRGLEKVVEMTFNEPGLSFYEAFELVFKELYEKIVQSIVMDELLLRLFYMLEMVIKSKDRIKLVQSIRDAKVHIFGSLAPSFAWEKHFGYKHPNVILHHPLTYEDGLQIMKKSKIVLNSGIKNKFGAHERIFAGLACGAAVLTYENAFLAEDFKDEESLLFYRPSEWDKINQKINLYLHDESKRKELAEKGRQITMQKHTWDCRLKGVMEKLESMIGKSS